MSDESTHTPDLDDLSNTAFGDFRLLRRLGVGGMAEVYQAEQLSLRRAVAIKVLRRDALSGTNNTLLKRFEQEARAAGGLSHPNIVQVYMIGQEGELNYIVQELVQGQNLSQAIKRNGPPDFQQGLAWMRDVAAALQAASDAGIVHRDIKPENIMLTRQHQAKVTDFGLAQLSEKNEKMNLTQAGTTMGTPWYMSPEQIKGETLDHRTDQYSFGVTCYQMFAGQPPFPGRNSVSVAVQHLKEDPKPLAQHRADLPSALCDVIHRMLKKEPDERFTTPQALLEALQNLENAPVNQQLGLGNSRLAWLRSSLPNMRQAVIAVGLCVIAGFVAGQRHFRPPRLVANGDPELGVKRDTPEEQIVQAMLDPDNEAAWKAVTNYHGNSVPALWARLHLAVMYLNKGGPDLKQADDTFRDLVTQADVYGQDELRFLATLGSACVAHRSDNAVARDEILRQQLERDRSFFEDNGLVAPGALLEFRDQMRPTLLNRG